jgi:hypothetical protein
VIKNHKSGQIPNTCGLLQGSALSPILFNLFTDDLLRALAASQGVKVYGVKITNLAFADDIAIVAETEAEIQKMTRIAEEWANNNEMTFNVNKCAYLGSSNNGPEMNNGIILKQQRTKYLGMIFNAQGLDTIASARERAKKANIRSLLFGRNGMNLNGTTIEASAALYKQFIRPMLEYGIQFMDEAGLKILQRAQENALRIMFSANRNSSKAALHLLSRIEHIKERQLIMQTSFFGFLHNNNDACIPAVRVWWNGILEKTNKGSLIRLARSKQGLSAITPMRPNPNPKLGKTQQQIRYRRSHQQ